MRSMAGWQAFEDNGHPEGVTALRSVTWYMGVGGMSSFSAPLRARGKKIGADGEGISDRHGQACTGVGSRFTPLLEIRTRPIKNQNDGAVAYFLPSRCARSNNLVGPEHTVFYAALRRYKSTYQLNSTYQRILAPNGTMAVFLLFRNLCFETTFSCH